MSLICSLISKKTLVKKMALNLELKIEVRNHESIIPLIIENGGNKEKLLNQKDIYFVFEKGLLKLRNVNGKYQLIKYNRNELEGDRWSEYSLLFLEGDNVEKYLTDLFEIETIVEKERVLFMYKNTRIHLDSVKNLGCFLELETVVNDICQEEAVIEFAETVKFLKLDLTEQIKCSYRDLMLKK
jgi:adenylate cyclase class IV